MLAIMPKLSEDTYGEILSKVDPLNVNKILDRLCPPNPELEMWRDRLIDAERHPNSGRSESGKRLAYMLGIGFDAGHYALTACGVYIPRVPWVYLGDNRRFPSGLVDVVLDEYHRDENAKGYIDATMGWSADRINDGAEAVGLANEGFAELYIAATRLRWENMVASN